MARKIAQAVRKETQVRRHDWNPSGRDSDGNKRQRCRVCGMLDSWAGAKLTCGGLAYQAARHSGTAKRKRQRELKARYPWL